MLIALGASKGLCLPTGICASPLGNVRENHWEALKEIDQICYLPWLLAGDFTEISKNGGGFNKTILFRGVMTNSRLAGDGGVVRYHLGCWVAGFAANIAKPAVF